jgi:hypothetical protein
LLFEPRHSSASTLYRLTACSRHGSWSDPLYQAHTWTKAVPLPCRRLPATVVPFTVIACRSSCIWKCASPSPTQQHQVQHQVQHQELPCIAPATQALVWAP